MAKITIEELSGSLKEYLNGLGLTEAQVQELIDKFEDEKIGDISQLSTEEKGSLVGAINELFQSANNGKELIASAIGEPLSSEDTFSAMSNDINGLLSTFKTNMMNNGITVEANDKFKALIDKVATMIEDGSGKGIQYAEGNTSLISSPNNNFAYMLKGDLYFKPNILIVDYYHDSYGDSLIYYNEFTDESNYIMCNGSQLNTVKAITELGGYITNTAFLLGYNIPSSSVPKKYYAIGVGEEDTTLRDSLASILEEEGVSVTEEDDMASLITKVDEEFTDKENEITNLETELEGKVSPAGTAVASDVLSGKTFINSTGELITGTNISYTFSNDTNSNFMYLVYSRLSDVQISMWRGGTNTLYNFTAPFSGTICFSLYGLTYTTGNYGPYFYIYDATTDTLLTDEYHIFSDAQDSPAIRHVTANVTKGHSIVLYAAPQGSATVHIFYYYGFQVHYPMS